MSVATKKAHSEAETHYWEVVRNMALDMVSRVEAGEISASERAASPKLEAACAAWEKVRAERTLRRTSA